MSNEVCPTLWIGPKYVTFCTSAFNEDGSVDMRQIPAVPLLNRFSKKFGNFKGLGFQERVLFHPVRGDTGVRVKIFPCDLFMKPYMPLVNEVNLRELESLRVERDYWFNRCLDLEKGITGLTDDVALKKKVLQDYYYYRTELNPFAGVPKKVWEGKK